MFNNDQLLKDKKTFLKSTALVAMPNIVLNPEEADRFIDLVIEQSFWAGNARIVKMGKNEMNIRYMDFDTTKRALRPSGTFTSADYITTLKEGRITLTAQKFRGCAVIYDDDLEDNIEGQAFADSLMKLIAKRVANELDEFYYVANTTSTGFPSTDIRHMTNGFRYELMAFTASSGDVPTAAHELDAGSSASFALSTGTGGQDVAVINPSAPYDTEYKFSKMISELPSKYKGDGNANLRFFCNPDIAYDYSSVLTERSTALGDKAILGTIPLQYNGIPISTVPLMPVTYATSTGGQGTVNYTSTSSATQKYGDVVLTHSKNFVIGLHRSLTMETTREAADEATYIFYSIRADCKIQNPDASVILYNVTHGE